MFSDLRLLSHTDEAQASLAERSARLVSTLTSGYELQSTQQSELYTQNSLDMPDVRCLVYASVNRGDSFRLFWFKQMLREHNVLNDTLVVYSG